MQARRIISLHDGPDVSRKSLNFSVFKRYKRQLGELETLLVRWCLQKMVGRRKMRKQNENMNSKDNARGSENIHVMRRGHNS